jgi:hypothetical protein
MNLLKRIPDQEESADTILVSDFRKQQYLLLEYFMHLIVNYISSQNKNYMTVHSIEIKNNISYLGGINSSSTTKIEVYILLSGEIEPKLFFKLIIPTLIEDTFYLLNGNYFVPSLYILDKPIAIKKNSIKLSSTFNSITIYDKLVTFMGTNIPANFFVEFIFNENDPEQLQTKLDMISEFNISKTNLSEKDIVQYFGNILHCEPIKKDIFNKMEIMFFDDYTKLLYQNCYNIRTEDLNLAKIIQISLKLRETAEKDMFIDLKFKRMVFIEILLSPLFKRTAILASQASRGYQPSVMSMDLLELVKYFRNDLHNKFIYDNVNAYDTMLQHKVHMLSPNVENAPSVVANLHPSHYQRICPISVSSQNPGETALLTAKTRVNSFGQFIGCL